MAKEKEDKKTQDLGDIVIAAANKKYKGLKVAQYLDDMESVSNWLDTGSTWLNIALSNRANGGWPFGRIIELAGQEGGGKSLLCAYAIKSVQEQGGIGIYIDSEHALDKDFMRAIGVDPTKLVVFEMVELEKIYELIEDMLLTTYEKDPTKPVVIVIDSMSGTLTENEAKGDYSKEGWNTDKAIINSKAMRKITSLIGRTNALLMITSQLRNKLGVAFGDQFCVDPHSTIMDIRYKKDLYSPKSDEWIYEKITFTEFSDRFVNNDDFDNPEEFDIDPEYEVEILGKNIDTNTDVYSPISSFIIKSNVPVHYTDGKLKCSRHHRIYGEDNNYSCVYEHPDFKQVDEPLQIVDIEVKDTHNYYANGRLNHNTTSGGHAIKFHCSGRIRLKAAGQIKAKVNGVEETIGIKTIAQIVKSRFGPNYRKAEFNIFYDRGIDDEGSWLTILKNYGMVTLGGAWYTYVDKDTLEEIKFQSTGFKKLLNERPELREKFRTEIENCLVTQYASSNFTEEDLEITDENDMDE